MFFQLYTTLQYQKFGLLGFFVVVLGDLLFSLGWVLLGGLGVFWF